MEQLSEQIFEEFSALVAIDSPSLAEHEMGIYLKEQLLSLGFSVLEDDAAHLLGGTQGNLHAFLAGTIPGEPILFCTHMDTVEPSCGKQAILHADGLITSKGDTVLGADDCAGTTAILQAMKTIQRLGLAHRSIEILFTVAEEIYCKGAAVFDATSLRSKQAYVLDLTGLVGGAAYKAPSILSFTIAVHGKASHAGFAPEDGVHAICVAAKAVSALEMGRIDKDTTLNIGKIEGGTATNVVAESCRVEGEIRSYSHDGAMQLLADVTTIFRTEAEKAGATISAAHLVHCKAYETPLDHPVVQRFIQVAEKLSLPVSLQETFGGSDLNHLAPLGITGIVLACAMNACHSCEEYTTIEELERIANLTLQLMTSEEP